jgi:hypothetical protein
MAMMHGHGRVKNPQQNPMSKVGDCCASESALLLCTMPSKCISMTLRAYKCHGSCNGVVKGVSRRLGKHGCSMKQRG